MYQIVLNVNHSIYEHIMFFLENLPKNLVDIQLKRDNNAQNDSKIQLGLAKGKVIYNGDIMEEDKTINSMFYGE